MAIEIKSKTPGCQSRRCAHVLPKKGTVSLDTIHRTTQRRRALVICAVPSPQEKFCAILVGRNNPINVATPDVLTHAEAAKSVTYEGG